MDSIASLPGEYNTTGNCATGYFDIPAMVFIQIISKKF